MTYKYLASPYTDPDPAVMQRRFEQAEHALNWLLNKRIWAYAPIVHCHELARKYALPKDHVFWRDYDRVMIMGSNGLLVLMLHGWKDSKGVIDEIEFAEDNGFQVMGMRSDSFFYTERTEYEIGYFSHSD